MTGADFTLTGHAELKQIFREFPEYGYRKPVMAAFRKAAKPVSKAMSGNLPSFLKSTRKIIKVTPGKGKSITMSVGFKGMQGMYKNRRGQMWDPYQLVYWFNYGTLANRLGTHTFKTPRKSKSAGRKGGIKPGLFVEKAWEDSKGDAQREFEKEVDVQLTKFFNERAAR